MAQRMFVKLRAIAPAVCSSVVIHGSVFSKSKFVFLAIARTPVPRARDGHKTDHWFPPRWVFALSSFSFNQIGPMPTGRPRSTAKETIDTYACPP